MCGQPVQKAIRRCASLARHLALHRAAGLGTHACALDDVLPQSRRRRQAPDEPPQDTHQLPPLDDDGRDARHQRDQGDDLLRVQELYGRPRRVPVRGALLRFRARPTSDPSARSTRPAAAATRAATASARSTSCQTSRRPRASGASSKPATACARRSSARRTRSWPGTRTTSSCCRSPTSASRSRKSCSIRATSASGGCVSLACAWYSGCETLTDSRACPLPRDRPPAGRPGRGRRQLDRVAAVRDPGSFLGQH